MSGTEESRLRNLVAGGAGGTHPDAVLGEGRFSIMPGRVTGIVLALVNSHEPAKDESCAGERPAAAVSSSAEESLS